MSERKYCSKRQGHPKVEKFEEGYTTCNTCRAREKDAKRETKRKQQKEKRHIQKKNKSISEKENIKGF